MQRLPNSEREVITFAAEVGVPTFFPKVGLGQVHGTEIKEYAHEHATARGCTGYIQCLRDNGGFCVGCAGTTIGFSPFKTLPSPSLRKLTLGDTPWLPERSRLL